MHAVSFQANKTISFESFHGTLGTVSSGVVTAFWVWLGFVVTGSSMEDMWVGKSKKLWLFEIAASLVIFLVMGTILALS